MYYNEVVLASLYSSLNNTRKSDEYVKRADHRREAIHNVLFINSETTVGYYDYNITSKSLKLGFSPSSYYPLWASATKPAVHNDHELMSRIFEPLEQKSTKHPGGIPTSDLETGEQWDGLNSWPPLQYLLIQASLANNKSDLALSIAQKYVSNTYCTFMTTKKQSGTGMMFEKYNASGIGQAGSGGEYDVVPGFGWRYYFEYLY